MKNTIQKIIILLSILLLSTYNTQAQNTEELNKPSKGDGGIVYYPEPTFTNDDIAKARKIEKENKGLRLTGIGTNFYTIKGLVQFDNKTPATGAIISILHKNKKEPLQAIADSLGRFQFNINDGEPTMLKVTFIGYNDLIFAASPEYHNGKYIIELSPKNVELDKQIMIRKPAIYLYPETKTKVTIKHDFKGQILTTYPVYDNGWEVIAEPNGKLHNLKDGRNYNYLFWDGSYAFPESHYQYKDGFYIKKRDYIQFLLEKLTHIGLNETEINDFTVYWLPELNSYDEVFIHFRINDDIGNSSKLTVTPQPDTIIRVFMEFKEWDNLSDKLPEQKLPSFKRKKFTLLEWGGGEIDFYSVR